MTAKRVSLCGSDWLYKDFVGEDWVWRNAVKPDTRDVRWWRTGTVPGSVHADLLRNQEIPDPYFERNSLLTEWVHQRTWVYKKWFKVDPAVRGKRIRLCFKGVDYEAQFFLNGERLGSHRSMFTPAEFDIGGKVDFEGDNVLAVVIERAPDEQPQVGRTSLVRTHKSRMTYWWDFCPRLVHLGIWDDVYLHITESATIEEVFIRSKPEDDARRADIAVDTVVHTDSECTVQVDVCITDEGTVIDSRTETLELSPGDRQLRFELSLAEPKLWWPNGMGEAHLYEVEVVLSVLGSDGPQLSDRYRHETGIRTVELVRNERSEPEARPYTFVVNGHRVYINGWNWVPIDAMYGVEQPEKLERLLRLARNANVNMLRVWGGGLIEKDAFYRLCNKYGIMVWQEFIQSSSGIENQTSADPAFISMMVGEAERIIPGKRNHPSLVVWCGGNELMDADSVPLDDSEPVLGALKQVVRRLDPDRHWFSASPTGRVSTNTMEHLDKDPTGLHDVHGPWEHQGLEKHYELYNRGTALFSSEFGVEGMTHLKTLRKVISEPNRWPAGKENPVYFHKGSWWNNESLVQEAFGGIDRLEQLVKASQFLQAEGLRYAVESNRRRQFQSSGTLPWQFNEPYPNAFCTSALDYYARPKPAYHAVARAYAPLTVTASFPAQVWQGRSRFEADIWISHAGAEASERWQMDVKLVDDRGTVVEQKSHDVDIPANGSVKATAFSGRLDELEADVFFLDLTLWDPQGTCRSSNRYPFSRTDNLAPLLRTVNHALDVAVLKEAGVWRLKLKNTGSHTVIGARLDDSREAGAPGYVYFSDNDFCLYPGEQREIHAEWSGIPAEQRGLAVEGLNAEIIPIH